MENVVTLLAWVAAGSTFGGIARFFVSGLVARTVGETFPWGTMVVNVTGAFAAGVLSALADMDVFFTSPETWPLAAIGFLGSYTTVSSFSLQTLALIQGGEWRRAAGNVAFSVVLCLSAIAGGLMGTQAALNGAHT